MENIRVLIADDHEMVREGIRSWLDAEDDIMVVGEVTRGGDIIHEISQCSPHVLLLDLHLPDLHGLEVIRQLRSAGNMIPIIVMTGYEKQRAKAALDAGADGFLNKGEQREYILDAVRWASRREGGKWLSPSVTKDLMETDMILAKIGLTKTELKVLSLIEHQNPRIAEKLFISEGTIKNHLSTIYSKLGVATRLEAANWARKHGILESRR
jgi:DNA-binding NarL/FixJ family response regulator